MTIHIAHSRKKHAKIIQIRCARGGGSRKEKISIAELRSGGRPGAVVRARHALSWLGIRELGFSGADVARFLGVTNSCITRSIAKGEKPDIDDIHLDL